MRGLLSNSRAGYLRISQWLKVMAVTVVVTVLLSGAGEVRAVGDRPELGVAVDPMKIKVRPGRMAYFSVINETDRDYIVTTRVVSDAGNNEQTEKTFFVNPPLRLLKKRDQATMGVVYLKDRDSGRAGTKYYLSVSFIPRVPEERKGITIPVVLVHQIPVTIE